jgi:hypothetical protein
MASVKATPREHAKKELQATRKAWLKIMSERAALPEEKWREVGDRFDIVPRSVREARLLYDVARQVLMHQEIAFLEGTEGPDDAKARKALALLLPPEVTPETRTIARYVLFLRGLDVLVRRGATSFAAARLPLRGLEVRVNGRVVTLPVRDERDDAAFNPARAHAKALPITFMLSLAGDLKKLDPKTERALFEQWPDTRPGRGKTSKWLLVRDAGIEMGWPPQELKTLKNHWKNGKKTSKK